MSEALREGSPLDKTAQREGFDPGFAEKLARHLNDPTVQIALLAEFKEYLVQYLALNQAPIPIGQIFGFSQYTAEYADDGLNGTTETTTSTSYTDLATAGPTLSGLPDGRYVVLFGATLKNSVGSGTFSLVSVSLNGGAADDNHVVGSELASFGAPGMKPLLVDLNTGGSNSVSLKYRVSAASTGTFARRWLMALRYANS